MEQDNTASDSAEMSESASVEKTYYAQWTGSKWELRANEPEQEPPESARIEITPEPTGAPAPLTLEELNAIDEILEDYAAPEKSCVITWMRARELAQRVRNLAVYMERKA